MEQKPKRNRLSKSELLKKHSIKCTSAKVPAEKSAGKNRIKNLDAIKWERHVVNTQMFYANDAAFEQRINTGDKLSKFDSDVNDPNLRKAINSTERLDFSSKKLKRLAGESCREFRRRVQEKVSRSSEKREFELLVIIAVCEFLKEPKEQPKHDRSGFGSLKEF